MFKYSQIELITNFIIYIILFSLCIYIFLDFHYKFKKIKKLKYELIFCTWKIKFIYISQYFVLSILTTLIIVFFCVTQIINNKNILYLIYSILIYLSIIYILFFVSISILNQNSFFTIIYQNKLICLDLIVELFEIEYGYYNIKHNYIYLIDINKQKFKIKYNLELLRILEQKFKIKINFM